MKRRSFLKKLGLGGAVLLIPFGLVKKPLKKVSGFELLKARTKAITEPCTDYQIVLVDEDGNHLWAPRTKSFTQDEKTGSTTFVAEDVKIDREVTLTGAKLLDPKKRVIGEETYTEPLYVTSFDIVKIIYRLRIT